MHTHELRSLVFAYDGVPTSTRRTEGSAIISQAIVARFRSPPDKPGICWLPISILNRTFFE